MSVLPEISEAEANLEWEKGWWKNYPNSLDGIVVSSLDELKELIPAEDRFGEVYLEKQKERSGTGTGYSIFSRPFIRDGKIKANFHVAYGCPSCEKIIIGFPGSKTEDSIGKAPLLSGREGYDLHCDNCHAHLEDYTMKLS